MYLPGVSSGKIGINETFISHFFHVNESGKTISGFVDTINFISTAVQFLVLFI